MSEEYIRNAPYAHPRRMFLFPGILKQYSTGTDRYKLIRKEKRQERRQSSVHRKQSSEMQEKTSSVGTFSPLWHPRARLLVPSNFQFLLSVSIRRNNSSWAYRQARWSCECGRFGSDDARCGTRGHYKANAGERLFSKGTNPSALLTLHNSKDGPENAEWCRAQRVTLIRGSSLIVLSTQPGNRFGQTLGVSTQRSVAKSRTCSNYLSVPFAWAG